MDQFGVVSSQWPLSGRTGQKVSSTQILEFLLPGGVAWVLKVRDKKTWYSLEGIANQNERRIAKCFHFEKDRN